MPLGAGVDHTDPNHEPVLKQFKLPSTILQEIRERLIEGHAVQVEDLDFLARAIQYNEDDLLDFYWQSSTAQCP